MRSPYQRRQILVGAGALATAGAALAAEPRRVREDFTHASLEDLVPARAGAWSGVQDPDVVPERVDGSVDHGQTVTRRYFADNLAPIMLVVSYHGPSSPDLKVHRPETCYAVAGFANTRPTSILTPLGAGLAVPSVSFSGRREERVETVVYWTRVGDRFPQTLAAQRLDFLSEAFEGYRADGLLMRASAVGPEPQRQLRDVQRFVAALVDGASPPGRRLLIGSLGRRQV